jgi:hypothetical protein
MQSASERGVRSRRSCSGAGCSRGSLSGGCAGGRGSACVVVVGAGAAGSSSSPPQPASAAMAARMAMRAHALTARTLPLV